VPDEGLPQRAKQSTRQVYGLRPDSGLYPDGIDNPFNALDLRQSSLIQIPQAGYLAGNIYQLFRDSELFIYLRKFAIHGRAETMWIFENAIEEDLCKQKR